MGQLDEASLGARLKAMREANGLSQRELAKRAGVTNSSISMLEQGQVNPSVSSLGKILSGIPMSLAHFFSCEDPDSDAVFCNREGLVRHDKPYGYVQVVGEPIENRRVSMRRIVVDPGSDTGEAPMMSHFDQVGWLTEGRARISIGALVREVGPGEGFYLKAYRSCRLVNLSTENPVELLVACQASHLPG